jgi:chemotaxis protein methyltransferase CheR
LFHESLCHRGFLVLGSKETPDFSAFGNQFTPLVKQERIYRKS